MAGWKRRFQRATTEFLRLPPDALLDVSRVTCLGAEKIVIENAVELLHVSDRQIEVTLSEQHVTIEGSNFIVSFISNREVHIEGDVEQIRYHRRDGMEQ